MAVIFSNVCFTEGEAFLSITTSQHQHSISSITTTLITVHYIKFDIHYTTTQSHHYEEKLLFYHHPPSSIFFTTTNECFLHLQSIYSHPTFHHHTLSSHHPSIHFQTPSTSQQSHPICNKTITHQSHNQSKQPTI